MRARGALGMEISQSKYKKYRASSYLLNSFVAVLWMVLPDTGSHTLHTRPETQADMRAFHLCRYVKNRICTGLVTWNIQVVRSKHGQTKARHFVN